MVSPAMTISLFWNKCPSIATPRYSISSSGVFLRLDSISTVTKLVTVNRKKAKYRKIVHHNLRGIIESRHVLCGVLCTPQIEGYCDHLPPLFERYWTFLILRTVELLPIWITFIDRIIDRIWFSSVVLTTELLNLAQIEPCCGVVVECDSLLAAQNSATKTVSTV